MNIPEKQRTDAQNKALHVYFEHVAKALNDAGFGLKTIIVPIDTPFTKELVKQIIWRPIQEAVLNKTSTTELKSQKDIDAVYEVMNRWLAEMGIHEDFPSVESMMNKVQS